VGELLEYAQWLSADEDEPLTDDQLARVEAGEAEIPPRRLRAPRGRATPPGAVRFDVRLVDLQIAIWTDSSATSRDALWLASRKSPRIRSEPHTKPLSGAVARRAAPLAS